MEILRDTHIDFMKYRRFWVAISFIFLAVGIFAIFFHGRLNVGIDFAGGTQLTVQLAERPDIDRLRTVLAGAGLGDAQIQRYGDEEDNAVLIRTPLQESTEEGSAEQILPALDQHFNAGAPSSFDLNQKGREALVELLLARDPDGVAAQDVETARSHYEKAADAIMEVRKREGLIRSVDQLSNVPEVSSEVRALLARESRLGAFAVLSVENVGPQVGAELRQKGMMAVLLSMVGMLIYVWVRFELRYGVGALMATVHDVLVTLGLYALFDYEFNLTTVAAFLTLIGYSMNDTVVVFDRVRENLRKNRREPLIETMNRSLNETLSRTILTGGCTFLVCVTLFLFGGEVIRGFAFVIMVGVVVGTYSSIFIACPFALLWEQYVGKDRRGAAGGGKSNLAEPKKQARAASR